MHLNTYMHFVVKDKNSFEEKTDVGSPLAMRIITTTYFVLVTS